MKQSADLAQWGPWNPGIESRLPEDLLPLVTLLRPENVFTSVEEAMELAAFTGLRPRQLVRFRPQRLVTHELLIRVSADFWVPDGSRYEDLGINARAMVAKIHHGYVQEEMPAIVSLYVELERQACALLNEILYATLYADNRPADVQADAPGFFERLGLKRSRQAVSLPVENRQQLELRAMGEWQDQADSAADELTRACCQALHKIASALFARHGALRADAPLLIRLASDRVLNHYGSDIIGRALEPCIRRAENNEGYRRLPAQAEPVIMNTKGASASGKSTLRPLQRRLADRLGLNWIDFALISPDIWRKYLLDYDSLQAHYKYAGTLTGDENSLVDRKLDRYMRAKAGRGEMSHLLIDRFRFDSFDPDAYERDGSNLLTQFGRHVYMFFVITPPHATVERAWSRGLKVGRFKAVDDLLDHNVEAFTGIPNLFFTWAERTDMVAHFEFLDNSVAQGEQPRTIAYGFKGELNILDVQRMLNITRYQKIDINAGNPDQVYPHGSVMDAANNTDFLRECCRRIPLINFVDRDSAGIYAHLQNGELEWVDPDLFPRAVMDPEIRAVFGCLAPQAIEGYFKGTKKAPPVDTTQLHILGQW